MTSKPVTLFSFKGSFYKGMFLFVCVLLLGCGYEQVASDLDQKQSNEIVAVLGQSGISARSKSDRRNRFIVEVPSQHYVVAVSILNSNELPRQPVPTFEELTRAKGLVPNSREIEAARLDYAIALEVEEKLEHLPGIVTAKVLLRSNFLNQDQRASASVIIETRPNAKIDENEIRRIVGLVVPGEQADRIQVVWSPVQSKSVAVSNVGVENKAGHTIQRPLVPFLSFIQIPENEYGRLAFALLFCIIVASALGLFLGFFMGQNFASTPTTIHQVTRLPDSRTDRRVLGGPTVPGGSKPGNTEQ